MFVNENEENASNFDPLTNSDCFHHIRGQNVTFSMNRTMAKCKEGLGHYNGLVFFHKPIRCLDEIRLEVLDWNRNGINQNLTVGITSKNPVTMMQNPLRVFITDLIRTQDWNAVTIPNSRTKNDKTLDVHCQMRTLGMGMTVRGEDGNIRYEDQIWEDTVGNGDKWLFIYMRGNSLKVHIKNPVEIISLYHVFDIAFTVLMSLVRDWAFDAISKWMFPQRAIQGSSSSNAITNPTTTITTTSSTSSTSITTTTTTSTANNLVPQAQAAALVPQPLPTQTTNAPNQGDNAQGGSECIICLDNRVNTCIVPCGHMCLCLTCSINYQSRSLIGRKNCPICRRSIDKIVQTFG